MFGKYEARVKLVKAEKPATDEPTETVAKPYQDPELMNEIIKDFVKSTAVVVVVGCAATLAWKAALEIIIRTVPDRKC